MAAPVQTGTQLLRRAAPTFADYIVQPDTWRERDASKESETMNEDGEVTNIAFSDPGVDVECEWVVKSGETPVVKGAEVVSTETAPRTFIVMAAETFQFGGVVLKQRVQLMFRTHLNSVLTT